MSSLHGGLCWLMALGATLLVPTGAGAATPERFPPDGVDLIEIEVTDVDLVLDVGSSDAISVESGSATQRKLELRDKRLSIHAHGGGQLRIQLPPGKSIDLGSRSGDVRANGAFTRFSASTASGDVRADVTADEIELSTLSGDVKLHGGAKVLSIQTVSGDVEVEGASPDVRGRTTSGDFVLLGELPHRLEVKTVSGEITLDGTLPKSARLQLLTTSGDVRVRPRGTVGYHLEASTKSGEVHAKEAELVRAGKKVEGTAKGGGSNIEVHSLSGDIWVEP